VDAPEDDTPQEVADPAGRRSVVRILVQLLRGSLLAWVPTALVSWYLSHRGALPYRNELGNVSFVMMFVAVFVGAAQVFNPQGKMHRFANWPRGSTFFPVGSMRRDLTGDELAGGISPGTVSFVVALELLVVSLKFSHG
jgi:hypothetical protein